MNSRSEPGNLETHAFETTRHAPPMDVAVLLEAMPSAVALFGPDRLLRFANQHARTLLRLDERALGAAPVIDVVLAPVQEAVTSIMRNGTVQHATAPATIARIRHGGADGASGEQLVEVRIASVGQGMLLFTANDVTARETLLSALGRRARELAAIFEVTPTMVRVLDASGAIVRANANAMREHAGARPTTIQELWERDAPTDATNDCPLPLDRHPGTLAVAGEVVRSRLLTVRRGADGERRVIEVYAAPVLDADERVLGAVLVDRDVTEEHRLALELEQQIKRSAALHERVSTEAERLDRMVEARSQELLSLQEARARERRLSAVGQLAAGVMHDVNNALNPIMAAAYLLRVHADNPEAVRDYADRIGKAAETGAATASRVGRFIRQEPTNADANQFVDLSVLTEEVLVFTQPLHAQCRGDGVRVEIAREYAAGVTTRGIAGEIREALLNLIQNAVDAMPQGGLLTARTGVTEGDAWVAISDSGQGMSADVRERAFEPFFSTKGAAGSGLGLAEVYGIARRHRGRVQIASELGRGTTVTLYFPVEGTINVTPAVDREPVTTRRVLVVEDHHDGREFLRQLLTADGHQVQVVSTYEGARAWLSGPDQPPFDLLLTDIGLPDGSGWDLVSLARRRWPSLRIGVVTGWEPTILGSGRETADFILRKPFRAAELLALVAHSATLAQTEHNHD